MDPDTPKNSEILTMKKIFFFKFFTKLSILGLKGFWGYLSSLKVKSGRFKVKSANNILKKGYFQNEKMATRWRKAIFWSFQFLS